MTTSVIAEIADKNDQDGAVCGTGRKKLMSLRFCEQAHGSREQQCEHNQNPNGVEGGVTITHRCQLVHGDNWKYEEDKDDECDNQSNKLLNPRLRIVVETFIIRLLAELLGREQFLDDRLVITSKVIVKS